MEPIKKIYQKHWNNYGINYVTNIYKTHFEVERFFTNGWQNSDYDIRRSKIAEFKERHNASVEKCNPEWVYEVALDR